jgi:hypothetical protein
MEPILGEEGWDGKTLNKNGLPIGKPVSLKGRLLYQVKAYTDFTERTGRHGEEL